MARITIEDCLKQGVENQFELVLVAAKRARRLANGAEPLVDWENDKPTEADPEPAPAMMPVESPLDLPADFRAPQFGLGD